MRFPTIMSQAYTDAGLFGAKRKYDIHTGVDLYCKEGESVYAMDNGVVLEIIPFTGESAGSPWWNETKAVVIQHPGKVVVYGEVNPRALRVGDDVTIGEKIANVKRVLKEDKGVNPTSMLHLEVWTDYYQSNFTWNHGQPQPLGLVNPLKFFPFWIIKSASGYKIETFSGHYTRYFASAVDCKAYCMWRTDEFDEQYVYVKTKEQQQQYFNATLKGLKFKW
jgi:hypothetical protein